MSAEAPSEVLACPDCGRGFTAEERFCPDCRMPLVFAGVESPEPARDAAHEHARKIRPEFARGDLVRVAGGRNQAEAELIQNLLLEEGVPSMLRRSAGFDVPDFLAAGPRDILVPASGAPAALDALQEADMAPTDEEEYRVSGRHAMLVLGGIVLGGLLAALIAWTMLQAVG
ncbi:MAG: hypothetical protein H0U42_04975 [Thermoleophilaceae bacterium]|nr:hypothetical protein [Thermoleophilaceae bacterium]